MATVIVYGEGGFNPDLPNGNVVDQYEVPDPPVDDAREQAIAKLAALGLTADEIAAILGG